MLKDGGGVPRDGGEPIISLHGVRKRGWMVWGATLGDGAVAMGPGVRHGVRRLSGRFSIPYCGFSCLIFGADVAVVADVVAGSCGWGAGVAVGDSDFMLSLLFGFGSFLDLVTRDLGGFVLFRLVG